MKINHSFVALGLLSILSFQFFPVAAQGASPGAPFLYRGDLEIDGKAADGIYDLSFTLFDTAAGGSALGGPVTEAATAVHHGKFAVTLDFGAGPYTGKNYWLEIKARPSGGKTYVEPGPRAPLRPSPYAHGPQGFMHHEEPLP
jgi:hypothetical protein